MENLDFNKIIIESAERISKHRELPLNKVCMCDILVHNFLVSNNPLLMEEKEADFLIEERLPNIVRNYYQITKLLGIPFLEIGIPKS